MAQYRVVSFESRGPWVQIPAVLVLRVPPLSDCRLMQSHLAINNHGFVILIQIRQGNAEVNHQG